MAVTLVGKAITEVVETLDELDEEQHNDLKLTLGISLCQQQERTQPRIQTHGIDFTGWVFDCDGVILAYTNGVLVETSNGEAYELDNQSISDLLDWEVLNPVKGHCCTLPLTECPECHAIVYMGADYICGTCRRLLR